VLVIACYQAFQARGIKSEFSEATYIGLAVFSMSQAFLTGIPIVVVVREIPQAFYLVLTFLIFLLCTVILLLIFLPKIFKQRAYAGMSEADQRKSMALSVRKSSVHSSISGLQNGSSHRLDSPKDMQDESAFTLSARFIHRQKALTLSSTSKNEDSNDFKHTKDGAAAVTVSAPFEIRQNSRSEDSNDFKEAAGLESKETTAKKSEDFNDFKAAGPVASHNMQDGEADTLSEPLGNLTTESTITIFA
jgi:competence protein ComGC